MLCWSRRRRPRTTLAAARWTISSLCSNVPVIPHRAALRKSSLDVTSACTSVLRALTGRDDRIRFMHRSCAYVVRQVRLTCAAIDIVESSCTPRSRMLVDAMILHPHTSMQRGGGCGMRLFGAANNMASVFFSFKSRQRDASHALTSITQRRIRSTADAESPCGKSTYNCMSSAYTWYRISCFKLFVNVIDSVIVCSVIVLCAQGMDLSRQHGFGGPPVGRFRPVKGAISQDRWSSTLTHCVRSVR